MQPCPLVASPVFLLKHPLFLKSYVLFFILGIGLQLAMSRGVEKERVWEKSDRYNYSNQLVRRIREMQWNI
uniref:Uncharacterized protein n=1 Tax=Zymomonas mobilis subsp. mobilis TaxID=120045 RepID=A0A1Z1NDP5_ZYMMB|nr:hypothetical protein B9T50_09085 [Zymomonas mobilis subsp. mobilis]